jgi:CubicO group peptidase (beta-lactamase class C family)
MRSQDRDVLHKHRRIRRVIATGLMLLAYSSVAGSRDSVPLRIDQYMRSRVALGQFSGAVLVAKGHKVIFRKAYGYADIGTRVAYTLTTPQYIASVSKMFTDMAILTLRDEGKLSLQDSVCAHLNNCPIAWQPITVQQLMRHTSGIPDYEEKLGLFSPAYLSYMREPGASARILESAKTLPLDFRPGEQFHYSNTGYVLLGYIAQHVAAVPFGEILVTDFLKPLRMRHTGISGYGPAPPRMAKGYTIEGWTWARAIGGISLDNSSVEERPMLPLTPPEGDAGIYSTVDDLLRWSLAMDGKAVIPSTDVAEALTPGMGSYGYGWRIDKEYGKRRVGHTGGLPGYVSAFSKFPDEKITVIVLCNLDTAPLRRTTHDIAAVVLGKPYDLPVKGTVVVLDGAAQARVAGQYLFSDGSLLKVSVGPRFMSAEVKGEYAVDLLPSSPTEFLVPQLDGTLTFNLDERGAVRKADFHYNGEDHVAVPVIPQ